MKTIFIILLLSMVASDVFSQDCNEANSLVSVRKRRAGNVEYVIFNVKSPVTATNSITDAQPPFTADGSGETVHVSGCKYKRVKFSNIVWTCKTALNFSSTTLIKQVKRSGQFEGQIEYIIGYKCNAGNVANYDYDDGDVKKYVVRFRR